MNRRDLLKALAAAPLLSHAGGLLAAPATNAKLLFVFLRGGYDANNLLVPIGSDFYYASRPNIAIAKPGADNGALALNADWALHPALRETIYPMFTGGEAAFIPFAGTTDLTRSHFETQDSIELGQELGGRRDFRSGFLNRLAQSLNSGKHAISFTDQLPLIFQGDVQVPNMGLRSVGKSGIDARQSQLIAAMYKGTPLQQPVSAGFAVREDVSRELTGEMQAANRNAISTKGFELEAQRIARLMKDKYNLGFVDVGGWDTHVGQGGANGYLAGRFDELGRGLAAFSQEMGSEWRNTVVVVVSEFGRTFRENGNRGTDHGHGSVFWVLGGGIKGKQVAGEQVAMSQATLFQNRDMPVLNEYRAVLGGLLRRTFGLTPAQLEHVFAGVKPVELGLV
ncbi:hypothetical protein JAB5_56460 [Janthinobacterium sp. HH103]|uniref:DUF1501 domain-containing protein n=1 Tax=unclassified Janthinobacterium TaxID=2610881 RepID=UPI00087462B0|nr:MULTISPECIES: DUF1501 domain-containing protein [unclassified Janthinobacterium]OEZ66575.1 hypothetical protein JAB5_56460 [Janthinobacterium sp. HH103]OEZ69521.1 hypothetical protein JAB2_12620 [Janthinobacterium sp. HH100]OEZ94155.1 hypothetical protein JAB9_41840 [Janthinobacterium sp. HH107]QOU72565.1 hypothetical protein JAB4_020010 [Janthinobacterium sp. HH102]